MDSPNQFRHEPPNRIRMPLFLAAMVVVLGLVLGSNMGYAQSQSVADTPLPNVTAHGEVDGASATPPVVTQSPATTTTEPEVTQTPEPTPEVTPTPYDFDEMAPETATVDMTWFADAVFVGDSRTDGLRLYSGITGCDFFCSKGISIFDVMDDDGQKLITVDGVKYTILEALALDTYEKVYICLGINELGYRDDELFADTFGELIDEVERLQPDAVIYLQSLVPVNEAKCLANSQPDYVTNERVEDYNEIIYQLAQEKEVVLIDLATGLVDEEGILPAEATSDGVHFTRSWYELWASYLLCHTVDETSYFFSQTHT